MGRFTLTPCPMQLSDMTTTEEGWYCGRCRTTVVDLTNATEEQVAEKLAQGPLCGRARTNAAGRLLFAGAAVIGLSGVAHADGNIPVPPIPEQSDTAELCDDSGDAANDGGGTGTGTGTATEPHNDAIDGNGIAPEPQFLERLPSERGFGMLERVRHGPSALPWGPQQSPEQARADRLAKRADRKMRRAERARAEADEAAQHDSSTSK